jgi:hypothetical protein
MANIVSVLDRAGALEPHPFPHIVIENALPEDYYWDLHRSLEPVPYSGSGVVRIVNNRFNVMPRVIKAQNWLDFIAYHESPAFLNDVARVFGVVKKGANQFTCQQAGNLPSVAEKTKVLGAHIDGDGIWFVGLLYMGSSEDQDGGDLQLCRWLGERQWTRGNRAVDETTEPVKTIPYKHNLFVGWINNNDAVHQVTPRRSDTYRRFCHILIRNPSVRLGG